MVRPQYERLFSMTLLLSIHPEASSLVIPRRRFECLFSMTLLLGATSFNHWKALRYTIIRMLSYGRGLRSSTSRRDVNTFQGSPYMVS